jgi:hypothetical protein
MFLLLEEHFGALEVNVIGQGQVNVAFIIISKFLYKEYILWNLHLISPN